jgi:hypothetical protein
MVRMGSRSKENNAMPNTFDSLLLMCGVAGIVMVVGSILLLYQGVIKLGEKSAGAALEAEFKDQLKINIRNPALGLFAIGFSFFVLALYFAKHEEGGPLVFTGHITVGDVNGILVRLTSEEWPISVSSEGDIFTTLQPLEKLAVVIEAPGYRPAKWFHPIRPDEAKNGRVEMKIPEFRPAVGIVLTNPPSAK